MSDQTNDNCSACGYALAHDARFCEWCGAAVATPPNTDDAELLQALLATTVPASPAPVPVPAAPAPPPAPVPAYEPQPDVPSYGYATGATGVDERESALVFAAPVKIGMARSIAMAVRDHRSVVAVAVAVVVVAAAAFTMLRLNTDLNEARDDRALAQRQLASTKAALREADDLATSLGKERDEAKAALLARTDEVESVRQSLSDSNQRVDLQASQITTLRTCLQGVAQALVDISYDDYYAASRSLQAVEASCEEADAFV